MLEMKVSLGNETTLPLVETSRGMLALRMSDSRRKRLVAPESDRLRIGVGVDKCDDDDEGRTELGYKVV